MSDLKVWHNHHDWVIATTPEDASKIIQDACGFSNEELADYSNWFSYRDEESLTMAVEIDTEPYFEMKTQSCRKWCKENGRGMLGSTEY